MAELYAVNNSTPSGGDDNEPRIDGDGQEVTLRFLGAGGPAGPPPPAPSSITPAVSSVGVSQPLQNQQQQQQQPHQQPPPAPQTPHQHQPPPQSAQQSVMVPGTPMGGGVVGASTYDPYTSIDPSRGGGGAYLGGGAMQIPPGPMSGGPYGPAAMMQGGQMMMMPGYGNYGMNMFPSPYAPFMGAAAAGPYPGMTPMQPQPSFSQAELAARLQVLRVQNPTYYRKWYKKYEAHRRNPRNYPFPPIEVAITGFPSMGPGSSQTLPSSYGRSRKESTRSSVNGDPYTLRGHPNDPLDYSQHVPNTSMSRGHHRSHSGRASVNDTHPPEDDFEIDGAPGVGPADMSSLSLAGHLGGNSLLHSTFNPQYQPSGVGGGPGSSGGGGSDRDRPQTQSGRSSTIGEPYASRLPPDVYGYPSDPYDNNSLNRYGGVGFQSISQMEQQVREPTPPPRRMTPMKFSTFHCISTMTPLGHMIRVRNSGAGTILDFVKMKQFVGHLPEYKEMEAFKGPLTQLSTHKSTVIQFCKRKIKEARSNAAQVDRNNYILLWEFLMLMLRQNGMVVGSDIAELLLTTVQQQKQEEKERRAALALVEQQVRDSVVEGSDGTGVGDGATGTSSPGGEEVTRKKEECEGESSGDEDNGQQMAFSSSGDLTVPPPTTTIATSPLEPRDDEKKLVEEFCSHLLEGHKKDALEYAMDNGLWGHALFFASKMDERTYGHVLARFANGIPLHSPLQTLYHIMCGKQPASVTNCGDGLLDSEGDNSATFGDWKPHLAMLLSNSGYKPDVERRAIITLGDTLFSKNHTFAAQFCYLMGLEEFRKNSRLGVLLGYSPQQKNVLEATQMSEVYEFARKLADPGFSLGSSFLQSKLDYAKRLVSYGFVEEALAYCEEITKVLRQSIGRTAPGEEDQQELTKLCKNTLKIAERIAAADENGSANVTWVEDLRRMAQEPEDISRKSSVITSSSNQEFSQSQSDQLSYNTVQPLHSSSAIGQPGGGMLPPGEGDPNPTYYEQFSQQTSSTQASSVATSDPYNPEGQSTIPPQGSGSNMMMNMEGALQQQPPPLQQQQQQEIGGYGGGDNMLDNWGGTNSQQQMLNGGLHLSQPPPSQQSPPLHQQQSMYDPASQVNMYGGAGQDGGVQTGYQQPMMDGANSGGYGDKHLTSAPTINNNNHNHWYNPYDSQPQPSNTGPDYSTNHHNQQQQHNSSPVKKKTVRFEDEHTTTTPAATSAAQMLVEEGNTNGISDTSNVGADISGNGSGNGGIKSESSSVMRGRNVGGCVASRPTDLDLKSALKNRRQLHSGKKMLAAAIVANGGVAALSSSGTTRFNSNGPSSLYDDDLETAGEGQDRSGGGGFEVEFKSTYPIDEPIDHLLHHHHSPPQVGVSAPMRLVNKKAPPQRIISSLVSPDNNHPTTHSQHQQQIYQQNNHLHGINNDNSSNNATLGAISASDIQKKTFPVDKECCSINQPCEDHDEFLGEDCFLEEEDDDEEMDDDEEGGGCGVVGGNTIVGGDGISGDIDGVENGDTRGYHHQYHYSRFENKTESSNSASTSSGGNASTGKKDAKKKGKEGGGLDGQQQQEKGWFSGLFKTLSLKPKNQMILPDDKNPTIVWDASKKIWVNKAGADGEDDLAPAGPPPKDSDLMMGGGGGGGVGLPQPPMPPMSMPPPQHQQQHQQQQQQQQLHQQQPQQPMSMPMMMGNHTGMNNGEYPQQQQPQQSALQQNNSLNGNNNNSTMNKYKLQRGRGLKGYVDVLNTNSAPGGGGNPASSPQPPSNPLMPMPIPNHHPHSQGAVIPNMFIPPPTHPGGSGLDTGAPVSFLTPAPPPAPISEQEVVPPNH